MRDAGFGIKITGPEQLMFISTRKCEINLILRDVKANDGACN